jgi:predicted ATP-dependent serine protease
MLRKSYPDYYISKNKIELTPEINVDQVLAEVHKKYQKQPVNTVDGVKIEFDKEIQSPSSASIAKVRVAPQPIILQKK